MKMIILQDANALKHFIENLSAPKIWNLQKEKLVVDRWKPGAPCSKVVAKHTI